MRKLFLENLRRSFRKEGMLLLSLREQRRIRGQEELLFDASNWHEKCGDEANGLAAEDDEVEKCSGSSDFNNSSSSLDTS